MKNSILLRSDRFSFEVPTTGDSPTGEDLAAQLKASLERKASSWTFDDPFFEDTTIMNSHRDGETFFIQVMWGADLGGEEVWFICFGQNHGFGCMSLFRRDPPDNEERICELRELVDRVLRSERNMYGSFEWLTEPEFDRIAYHRLLPSGADADLESSVD